jgi:hypothetical protein
MTYEERLFKASILLGIALGGIKSMYWTKVDDDDAASVLYESMASLIICIENGVDEIFYKTNKDSIE